MKTMKFLYTHTNYAKIYKEQLSDAYYNAKIDIRDTYGFIDDLIEYENILNTYVDKHNISLRSQEIALRGNKNYLSKK
jgi:hypothetical protein